MSTQYYFPPYNASVAWKKSDPIYDGSYFYATQDTIVGGASSAPTLQILYNVTGSMRQDDVTTLYFTQTGNVCNFQRGSIIKAAGLTNSSMNYTGMALNGGSGFANFINPGWPESLAVSVGTVSGPNPAFTSGFFFTPTYSTKIATENTPIVTQLGNNYSQRMSQGLNSFDQNITMVFQNRETREARAISNYVQDSMGVRAVEIMLGDPILNNQPNQKWALQNCEVTPVSYSLADITVQAKRVFDL